MPRGLWGLVGVWEVTCFALLSLMLSLSCSCGKDDDDDNDDDDDDDEDGDVGDDEAEMTSFCGVSGLCWIFFGEIGAIGIFGIGEIDSYNNTCMLYV